MDGDSARGLINLPGVHVVGVRVHGEPRHRLSQHERHQAAGRMTIMKRSTVV